MDRPKIRPVAAEVEMTPLPPRHDAHALEREIVQREVDGEGDELVEEERDQSHDGGVLSQMPEREGGEGVRGPGGLVLGPGVWHEGDVFVEVVGVLVVGLVGEAPAVVGGEEGAVDGQADGVVDPAVLGKGAVAGLVGYLPEACED